MAGKGHRLPAAGETHGHAQPRKLALRLGGAAEIIRLFRNLENGEPRDGRILRPSLTRLFFCCLHTLGWG